METKKEKIARLESENRKLKLDNQQLENACGEWNEYYHYLLDDITRLTTARTNAYAL